jgi:hypothetical protein
VAALNFTILHIIAQKVDLGIIKYSPQAQGSQEHGSFPGPKGGSINAMPKYT